MSAVASFIRLPASVIPGLRDAAVPKKSFFGGTKDTFHDFLRKNGREVVSYDWSGYVLATLLPCLEERGIDLMKSEHDDLSRYLSEKRQATCFVLTSTQRKHLAQLDPELFAEAELCDYYNQFNAAKESEVGKAMLDGVRALRDSLQSVDDDSIVLLTIG